VEPTIVRARPDMPVVQEETFAPSCTSWTSTAGRGDRLPQRRDAGAELRDVHHERDLAETFLSARGSDAASRTSTSAHRVPRSAAPSGARRNRRRARGGQRFVEAVHAPSDLHHQLGKELPLAQGVRFGRGVGARSAAATRARLSPGPDYGINWSPSKVVGQAAPVGSAAAPPRRGGPEIRRSCRDNRVLWPRRS